MVKVLKGENTLLFARKHADRAIKTMQLVPYQTGATFDPSRESNSTTTKSGPVSTTSSVETDAKVNFLNNTSSIADELLQSIFDGDLMDLEFVHTDRQNDEGKYDAWYMQGKVSEDSSDNDADDSSTREVSFAIDGTPKHGWTDFTPEQQADADYLFYGLDKVTDEDKTGGGTAWTDADNGKAADLSGK
jgi:phage major tail protein, TP901-1 family